MIRAMVICCEGKTESEYFKILKKVFRISALDISVYPEVGQHKSLIERTAEKRAERAKELELQEDEVECWAVCDDDKMKIKYKELMDYADEHEVLVAFSKPFFEAYLVQHFRQSKACKKQELYDILSEQRAANGFEGRYNDSTKADLKWLEVAIDEKPSIIDVAIINSDLRNKQTASCFLTVQELTKRLQENAVR